MSESTQEFSETSARSSLDEFSRKIYSTTSFGRSIERICKPFMKRHGMNSFEFARVYDDGTCFMLYSDVRISRLLVKAGLPVTFHVPDALVRNSFWYLPPQDGPYNPFLREIKEMSNVGSFIDYVERQYGYYDMFCFFSPFPNEVAANQFLNKRDECESFSKFFREKSKELILLSDQDRFQLPASMVPNIKGLDTPSSQTELTPNIIQVVDKEVDAILSRKLHTGFSNREIQCIKLLFIGASSKEIGKQMGLSYRTVEFYLRNIKAKIGCNKKSEIVQHLLAQSAA